MTHSHYVAPPLSPVLLAGLELRPLPPALLEPALGAAMIAITRRHRGLFERLADLDAPLSPVEPVDLPFAFVRRAVDDEASLSMAGDGDENDVAAVIRGPLLGLIDLLEGCHDGDALFFSRQLVVEGVAWRHGAAEFGRQGRCWVQPPRLPCAASAEGWPSG